MTEAAAATTIPRFTQQYPITFQPGSSSHAAILTQRRSNLQRVCVFDYEHGESVGAVLRPLYCAIAMSDERTPLNPQRPTVHFEGGQYRSASSEFASSVDEDGSSYIRVHRRTVYCLLGYALLASILAVAFLLAFLLSSGTRSHHAGGTGRPQRPIEPMRPSPPPMPSDPSSPSLHGPLPTRRNWNKSHLAHFLLLTDIHLEPHYNPTAPNSHYGVCRDERYMQACEAADWELAVPQVQASGSFSFGRYMCDPPHSLVSAALRSLATSLAMVHLDAVLLPGDLAAHFIACPSTVYSVINRTLALLTAAFPSAPVIFSIGNTDIYPTSSLPPLHSEPVAADTAAAADVHSGCQTAFSPLLGLLLVHGMLNERTDEGSIRTFCRGGYYGKHINNGTIRVLSLNTIVWAEQLFDSSSQANRTNTDSNYPSPVTAGNSPVACEGRPIDPYGQLEWLEAEVRSAAEKRQHVWLVGHTPPGVKAGQQGWCWQYWQRVERLLHGYGSVITQLHFGDYSQDMVRLVPRSSNTAQRSAYGGGASHTIHINPGLSPRKNVNPAARVYTYNRTSSHIIDYQQLYIDLGRLHTTPTTTPHYTTTHSNNNNNHTHRPLSPHWLFQYNALDAYAMDAYGTAGWLDALRRMRWTDDGVLLERYVRGVNVWKAGVGDGVNYLCDVMAMELADNRRCKQTGVVPGLEEAE